MGRQVIASVAKADRRHRYIVRISGLSPYATRPSDGLRAMSAGLIDGPRIAHAERELSIVLCSDAGPRGPMTAGAGAVALAILPWPSTAFDVLWGIRLILATVMLLAAVASLRGGCAPRSVGDAHLDTGPPIVSFGPPIVSLAARLTALCGLVLCVASTTAFLVNAQTGRVIDALGRPFVGHAVGGLIVFVALTLAQLGVVARSARRVATRAHESPVFDAINRAMRVSMVDAFMGVGVSVINLVAGLLTRSGHSSPAMYQAIEKTVLLTIGRGTGAPAPHHRRRVRRTDPGHPPSGSEASLRGRRGPTNRRIAERPRWPGRPAPVENRGADAGCPTDLRPADHRRRTAPSGSRCRAPRSGPPRASHAPPEGGRAERPAEGGRAERPAESRRAARRAEGGCAPAEGRRAARLPGRRHRSPAGRRRDRPGGSKKPSATRSSARRAALACA